MIVAMPEFPSVWVVPVVVRTMSEADREHCRELRAELERELSPQRRKDVLTCLQEIENDYE